MTTDDLRGVPAVEFIAAEYGITPDRGDEMTTDDRKRPNIVQNYEADLNTPLDLVADNRRWVRLHEHNKYQAAAARRITVLLAEVERLRRGRNIWRDQADRAEAALARVRELLSGWNTDHGDNALWHEIDTALTEETK